MPSKRKFYRHDFRVEILSEEPIPVMTLKGMHEFIVDKQCAVQIGSHGGYRVSGDIVATMLKGQHSDPGIFGLTEDGEDMEER